MTKKTILAASAALLLAATAASADPVHYVWNGTGINAMGATKCPTYKMVINVTVDGDSVKGKFQQEGRPERSFETTLGKNGAITGGITADVDLDVDQRSVRINTRDGASEVLNLLDVTMDKVNATRATMGAVMNRLDHVINNLSNVSMNLSASRSQIQDADYAAASTDLAKSQIISQAATAMLAQANQSSQNILSLLK